MDYSPVQNGVEKQIPPTEIMGTWQKKKRTIFKPHWSETHPLQRHRNGEEFEKALIYTVIPGDL